MTKQDRVICDKHGEDRSATFVCHHLAEGTAKEFRSDETPTDDNPWPDAYCEVCAEFRDGRGGEWDTESENFADVKVLCDGCYEERRTKLTAA